MAAGLLMPNVIRLEGASDAGLAALVADQLDYRTAAEKDAVNPLFGPAFDAAVIANPAEPGRRPRPSAWPRRGGFRSCSSAPTRCRRRRRPRSARPAGHRQDARHRRPVVGQRGRPGAGPGPDTARRRRLSTRRPRRSWRVRGARPAEQRRLRRRRLAADGRALLGGVVARATGMLVLAPGAAAADGSDAGVQLRADRDLPVRRPRAAPGRPAAAAATTTAAAAATAAGDRDAARQRRPRRRPQRRPHPRPTRRPRSRGSRGATTQKLGRTVVGHGHLHVGAVHGGRQGDDRRAEGRPPERQALHAEERHREARAGAKRTVRLRDLDGRASTDPAGAQGTQVGLGQVHGHRVATPPATGAR